MGLKLKQLAALLRHKWTLRKRHKIRTLIEFLLPLLAPIVLVALISRSSLDLASQRPQKSGPYHEKTFYKQPTFNLLNNDWNKAVSGQILYAPKNQFTVNLTTKMAQLFNATKRQDSSPQFPILFCGYEDENALISTWLKRADFHLDFVRAAIVFTSDFKAINTTDEWTNFTYKIRLDDTNEVSQTTLKFPMKYVPGETAVNTNYVILTLVASLRSWS